MDSTSFALITGASSGIGECFARRLATRGANLVLVARSEDKLRALADELKKANGVRAEPLANDLSLPGSAARLADEFSKRGLSIDLLINNAAFGARGEFWNLPLDRQSEMLRLNITTLMELTHLLLPSMVARRTGAIINVSSMAGFQPMPYMLVYSAMKAFLTSFSLALAEELRPYGIRVVTLSPGVTRTNFVVVGEPGRGRLPGRGQTAEEVVEAALKKFGRGSGLVVPGLGNKLGVFVERFVPRSWVVKMAGRMARGRKDP